MLTGIAYEKVRKAIRPKRKKYKSIDGVFISTVIRFLKKKNIKYRDRVRIDKIKLSKLKNNAYIAYYNPSGSGHAVVWDAKNKKILDSNDYKPRHLNYINNNLKYIIEILK